MSQNPVGSLSIVVPLYNESAGVPALIASLVSLGDRARPLREVEFVLVDDGSSDDTDEALADAIGDRPGFRVLRHPENRGPTAALRTGSEAARGALIGWFDADLTYDPAILLELLGRIDAGADLAVASCHHPDGRVEGVSGWRLGLSRMASRLHRAASGADLCTFTCMVRVQRRAVLEATWPDRGGFVGVTEQLVRALQAGHRIDEAPAVLRRRKTGQSKMRVLRVGLAHVGLAVATRRRRFSGPRDDAPPRAHDA